ncbi:autotransporter-associated beta strand repeat-containing protein, partial [Mesorhizobium sp. BR1-1-13]|uniref:beta strand repeat-containing protein n=1 Tax=Mesorhizobium sp. BR1-1-13 TaxID=2876656 RepID=UPI001CD0C4A5
MQQTTRHQASGTQRQSKNERESEAPGGRPAAAFSHLLRGGRMTKWKGEAASFAPNLAHLVSAVEKSASGGLLAAALLAGLVATPAGATDRYWDVNGTTVGLGGAETWNTTTALWNNQTQAGPMVVWDNAAFDNAVFAGTAAIVTIGAPITAGGLTFNVGGYTLNGGTLTLGGATPTINAAVGATTINSVIAGTAGLTKSGGANLILTGNNTFSGGITLNGGVLEADDNAALGDLSNNITVTSGSRLQIDSGTTSRTVTINSGVGLLIQGPGTGGARYTGGGNLTLNSATNYLTNDSSDYTGTTFFNGVAGTADYRFTSIGNVGGGASSLGAPTSVANGTITIQGNAPSTDNLRYIGDGDSSDRNWIFSGAAQAQLINSGTGTLTLTGGISMTTTASSAAFTADTANLALLGVISGTPGVSLTGTGPFSVTLGTANTYSGTTTIQGGIINASVLTDTGTAGSFGTGSTISLLNLGTANYTGVGSSSNRSWTIDGSAAISNSGSGGLALGGPLSFTANATADTLTLGGNYSGINTISGVISGSGDLASNGSTTWQLSGANTRTGKVIVNGGTLQMGSASAFGTTSGVTVNGGTLDLNDFNLTTPTLNGTGGTVDLGAGTLTVNSASASSYAGQIIGTGGLTKLGNSTLTLSGANSYTGATNVGGGTLALDFSPAGAPNNNIISGSSALTLSGGTLRVIGAAGEGNSQSFAGLTVTSGSNTIRTDSGASAGSVNLSLGAISRTGGLVNFVLPTSGAITTANADGALGGWATINGSDYAKVVSGGIVAFDAADYTNQDDAGLWTADQVISDADGDGDSFFGTVGTSVMLGGLRYTTADATPNPNFFTIAAGQTLGVDGTIIVAPSVGTSNQMIQGPGFLTGGPGGGTLGVQQNGGGTFTIAANIVNNGGATGFAKGGTGTVVLTGNNTYTGVTTLTDGTLVVSNIGPGSTASNIGQSSAASSNLVIEGGTLRYTGGNATTDRGFTLVNGGLSRTIQVDGSSNLTFSGLVTSPDDAGFTKTGTGTLTLTNASNNYIGVTTISGGTLAVSTLSNGGAASSIGASSNDSANLVLNGGELSYIGATASSDRGYTLQNTSTISVTNAASTLTLSGTATGPAGFFKNGAGTLVLAGTNNFAGNVVVNAGVLRAGSTQAFGSAITTVNSGATLDLNNFSNSVAGLPGTGAVSLGSGTLTITHGFNSAFSGAIGGTGGLTKSGPGNQTLSGCGNNYTGATTINGGTLSVDCLANGTLASGIGASTNASSNLVLANSGVLAYTGGNVSIDRGFTLASSDSYIDVIGGTTLEFKGTVTGGGRLRKSNSGVLVLSGSNNFTGGTVVDAGVLRAGSTNAFGSGFSTVTATLDLAGYDQSIFGLSGAGFSGGNVLLGGATLTFTNGNNRDYGGVISGSGNLIKNGAAAQVLSGCNNTYHGSTTVNAGILIVSCLNNGGSASSIGDSGSAASNLVLNGGTLRYTGTGSSTDRQFTLGTSGGTLDASGTGAVSFTSTVPVTLSGSGDRTLTLTGSNTGNNSLSARIDNPSGGTASLSKTGNGTWVLKNAASTYTGATTIGGGVLAVDKLANGLQASSIGQSSKAASNLVIGTGSTLRYTGSGDTTDRLFTLSTGVSTIESSGTGAIVFSDTGSAAYTGNGARTLALGGTNTGLNTMGGTIIDGSGGATTLAKNDAGTWVLTGNNSYSGNTVINDGNLMIGNGGTTGNAGTGNVIVDKATSTLSFNRSDTFNFAGNLSGAGNIAQIGTGTTRLTTATDSSIGGSTRVDVGMLELASNLTSNGGTTVNAGTLQVDAGKTLTTPTLAMNAGSTLNVSGTVQAAGATPVAITGDAGASTINIANGGTLRGNGDLGGGSDIVNLTGTLNTGAGVLNLGAGNDVLTLNDGGILTGTVNAGTGGETGAGDTLQVKNNAARTLDGVNVSGFESLNKQGTATLTLTGNHSYSGGSTISGGTLEVGNGAVAGALVTPTVTNNGTLAFNLNSNYAFGGLISGTGSVNKLGTGTTTLTGTNSHTGATNVNAGTLLIDGNQSAATGQTNVATGATLGGTGIIGGSVTVADGGTLAPGGAGNIPGMLTINGNLALGNSNLNANFGQAGVPGGAFNDLIDVGGNLTLDGTLNITQSPGGTFGPGVYRVMSYNGTLTDNGLTVTDPDYFVQTSVAKQVNLVNSAGLALSFWDGDAGPHSNGAVDGGSGTWRAAGDQNWTDSTGLFAAPFANASFAIFQGTAGTVTVDSISNGQVQAAGMQFATDGYVVQGNGIELVDDSTQAGLQSVIRVGDGTSAGAAYVATIASNLTGATQLVKTDLGTLVLSGTNSYSGGTFVDGGTLQVGSNASLGAAAGALTFDDGTLHTTDTFAAARDVTLNAGGGTFYTNALTTLTLTGTVAGAGTLTKTAAGTLVLTGANSYQGGTFIDGGTIEVSADANLGNAAGALTFDNGTLHTTGTFTAARSATLNAGGGTFDTDVSTVLTLTGAVGGAGALTKDGAGTLVLTADNSYAGGTTIAGGTLQLGNGGATGSITGDVVDNGTLAFDRNDSYGFAGLISGSGGLDQIGSGITILTADNSYAGATNVREGTLIIDGDQSAATGATTVEAGGALGGVGTIGGDVSVLDNGALNPGDIGATPGTLTINGNLDLAANATLNYNFGQAGVVGGAYNDLTIVHGDLTLDGTINVAETPGGNFGPGLYRIISYDGALTDLGLTESSPNHVVQTSVANQVNLVDISAMTLNFWDGDAGPKSNDGVDGGNGTWRSAGDDNWTGPDGDINAAFSNGSFAIFAGTAGTVTVDNTNGQVQASGMQFATGGYVVQGQNIELVGPQATIRVGDGTLPGAGYTATIASVLEGSSQLVKSDLGTLVLTGTNTYTGGTRINQGTLQFTSDANLGDASGSLTLDGGTLRNAMAIALARGATLGAGNGTFETLGDLTINGLIDGVGGFTKTGSAALTLTGANAYAGATTVTAGDLYVDGDQSAATGPTSVEIGATLGGKGTIGGNVTVADGATLSPGSADGTPGTLAIAGDLSLSGGSILNYSFGQANVAGGALNDLTTVGGNLVLDGTLNVTVPSGGTFGPGIYRVFDYSGTLTNNGLSVGSV